MNRRKVRGNAYLRLDSYSFFLSIWATCHLQKDWWYFYKSYYWHILFFYSKCKL